MSNNIAELRSELLYLMKAKTPIIYIVGTDERAILEDIRLCASSIKLENMKKDKKSPAGSKDEEPDDTYGYFEWSATKGLLNSNLTEVGQINERPWTNLINGQEEKYILFPDDKAPDDTTQELMPALDIIGSDYPKHKQYNFNHRTVVLKDIHKHLESNPFVVRRIKEIALYEDRNEIISHQVIILSPVKFIPIEFQNYVHVMEWNLPNKEEILTFLQDKLKAIAPTDKGNAFKDTEFEKHIYSAESLEAVVNNFTGLSYPEIKSISAISKQKKAKLDEALILEHKRQLILKNGILEYHNYELGMEDVGGMENFKAWVDMRKKAFSSEAKKFGVEPPKGALLVGIQGCGKSLMAKSLAANWKIPLLRLDVGKVFAKTVGSSEENMRLAISTIEATAPNVVLIDEIEKGLAGVQSSTFSDSGTTARVVGTLLSWLNDKKAPAFIIATANNISYLPPELLRKGRFDEIFFCGLPAKEERAQIFKIHLTRRGRDPKKFDTDSFAELSEDFSGAEIEESIKAALIEALDKGQKDVTNDNIRNALNSIVPLVKTCAEDIAHLYDWVGWDDKKQDGIKARYASKYRQQLIAPTTGQKQDGKVITVD